MTLRLETNSHDHEHLIFIFHGELTHETIPSVWQTCLDFQKKYQPNRLTIKMGNVTYCDGAGIALLLTLKKSQAVLEKNLEFQSLSPQLQTLLELIEKPPQKITPITPETHQNLRTRLGCATVSIFKYLKESVIFLGELMQQLSAWLIHPKNLRWRDLWKIVVDGIFASIYYVLGI